jgi:hypothetical protein
MTSCAHVRPLLGGYVLGGLEPDEEAAVRAHLETCPGCAREHARLAPLPALLDRARGLEIPEPRGEERLLDAVAAERGPTTLAARRTGRRRALAGGALALAAALALALVLVLPGRSGYEVALRGTPVAPRASATATLRAVDGGTRVRLDVRGLPAGSRAVYEVRCSAPGWSASAGTFRVDASGRASLVLTTAARQGEYDRIEVVRGDEPVLAGRLGRSGVRTAELGGTRENGASRSRQARPEGWPNLRENGAGRSRQAMP